MSIESGVLYVVATPIGNLEDLSSRAKSILKSVDLIAVEDTRHSRPLLHHFGISTPMQAYHEHNERQALGRFIDRLRAGESIALISDAGTPLISDPGFPLVRECRQQCIRVVPIPGPSALVTALSAAGMATDRFIFEGFPERSGSARQRQFEALLHEPRTLIFYESSHRICASLEDMATVFGAERQVVVARELTKRFETFLAGSMGEVLGQIAKDAHQKLGEFVVLVAGFTPPPEGEALEPEAEKILRILTDELPLKQAASLTAKITGLKKNRLYQQALTWQRE